jgi:hypothetical protein
MPRNSLCLGGSNKLPGRPCFAEALQGRPVGGLIKR